MFSVALLFWFHSLVQVKGESEGAKVGETRHATATRMNHWSMSNGYGYTYTGHTMISTLKPPSGGQLMF